MKKILFVIISLYLVGCDYDDHTPGYNYGYPAAQHCELFPYAPDCLYYQPPFYPCEYEAFGPYPHWPTDCSAR